MERITHFINNEFSLEEENTYLNTIFTHVFDQQYKNRWEQKLRAVHKLEKNKKRGFRRKYLLLVIASGIAACISAVLLITNLNSNDPQMYANTVLDKDELFHPDVVKGVVTANQLLLDAAIAFNSQEYESVISIYQEYGINQELSAKEIYFKGLAELKTKNFIQSSQSLSLLLDNEVYAQEARWYYSLALLFDDKVEQAKSSLSEIKAGDWNYESARKIIDLIK